MFNKVSLTPNVVCEDQSVCLREQTLELQPHQHKDLEGEKTTKSSGNKLDMVTGQQLDVQGWWPMSR